MQRTFSALALIASVVPIGASAQKIIIDKMKIDAADVCGIDYAKFKCATSTESISLDTAPYVMERVKGRTDWDGLTVFDVLGRTYSAGKLSGKNTLKSCPALKFAKADLADEDDPTKISAGFSIANSASVNAKIDFAILLRRAGIISPSNSLIAELKGSFEKRSTQSYDMDGWFQRISLQRAVIDELDDPETVNARFSKCAKFLDANPKRGIITSIAVTRLDDSNLNSNIAKNIQADMFARLKSVKADADIGSFNAAVEHEVTRYLTVVKGVQYRTIAFDYL